MTFHPLGRVNVVTPGTPVPLGTGKAAMLYVQVVPGLSGKLYIGSASMNRATLAGVGRVLWPNGGGGISDEWWVRVGGIDGLDLGDYFVDADVPGEGPIVSTWAVRAWPVLP